MSRRSKLVIVVRKSCITGKVVWLYRGKSRAAARTAYWRACREEVRRVHHWSETTAERKANIITLLNACLADLDITDRLTPQQVVAARQLRSLSKEDIASHREFYEHILEERRRRAEDKEIRRQMRARQSTPPPMSNNE